MTQENQLPWLEPVAAQLVFESLELAAIKMAVENWNAHSQAGWRLAWQNAFSRLSGDDRQETLAILPTIEPPIPPDAWRELCLELFRFYVEDISDRWQQADHRVEALENKFFALRDLSRVINNTQMIDEVLDFTSNALLGLLDASHAAVFLLDEERSLVLKSAKGFEEKTYTLAAKEGLLGRVAASRLPVNYETLAPEEASQLAPGLPLGVLGSAMLVPLLIANRLLGVILVGHTRSYAFDSSSLALLDTVAMHLANGIQNALLFETANQQAITDGMTNLFNHRFFQEELRRLVSNYQRYQRPFSLLMIDVDRFKAINESYGHPIGDEVLRKLAALLVHELRITDIATRYGGDEIAILLNETPLERATSVAEHLVEKVAEIPFTISDDLVIPLSISIGVASFPEQANNPSELVAQADRSLYQAKHSGRNQVGRL